MNRNLIISTWTPATDIIKIMNGETPFKLVINESSIPDEKEVELIVLLAFSIPYFRYEKSNDMGVERVSKVQKINLIESVYYKVARYLNLIFIQDKSVFDEALSESVVAGLNRERPQVKLQFIKNVLLSICGYTGTDDAINVGRPIDLNRIQNKIETDECPICLQGFKSLKAHGVFTCCKNLCHTECYKSIQTNAVGAACCPFCRTQPLSFKKMPDEQSTNSDEQSTNSDEQSTNTEEQSNSVSNYISILNQMAPQISQAQRINRKHEEEERKRKEEEEERKRKEEEEEERKRKEEEEEEERKRTEEDRIMFALNSRELTFPETQKQANDTIEKLEKKLLAQNIKNEQLQKYGGKGKRSHHRRKPKRRSSTKHSQKHRLQRVAHQTLNRCTKRRSTRRTNRRRTYLGGGRRRNSIRI